MLRREATLLLSKCTDEPPGRSSTTGERRARATYRPRLGQQQRRWHSPTAPAYTLVCIRAVDVRRGARWGDLLTQFVENMTQPRDSLPLITYTSLRLCRCPSLVPPLLFLSLSLYTHLPLVRPLSISLPLSQTLSLPPRAFRLPHRCACVFLSPTPFAPSPLVCPPSQFCLAKNHNASFSLSFANRYLTPPSRSLTLTFSLPHICFPLPPCPVLHRLIYSLANTLSRSFPYK